jgi:hypothetical protein
VWLAYLSDYLRGREDGGERPGALTREDMTAITVTATVTVAMILAALGTVSGLRSRMFTAWGWAGGGAAALPSGAVMGLAPYDRRNAAGRANTRITSRCCGVVGFAGQPHLDWVMEERHGVIASVRPIVVRGYEGQATGAAT